MAKPMLVTLPLVFLLLDLWPLGRLSWPPRLRSLAPLVLEKLPLLALSAAASVVTVIAQHQTGAVQSLARVPFAARFANASIGYATYIAKSLWPASLGVLYPIHPLSTPAAVASLVTLLAVTLIAILFARTRPYILVGWLLFLGMLVPVIGLVQVGSQSTADRYMYLPLVGLSIAVVWSIADLVAGRRLLERAAAVLACVVLVAFAVTAHAQAGYWQSSRTLFERTLAVTRANSIMHNNLGVVLVREGRFDEALAQYNAALVINPDYPDAHANAAHELMRQGRFADALPHLARALALAPHHAQALGDLGTLLAAEGRLDEARARLEESLLLKPDQPEIHNNLAFVLRRLGLNNEAIAQYQAVLRLNPRHPAALNALNELQHPR